MVNAQGKDNSDNHIYGRWRRFKTGNAEFPHQQGLMRDDGVVAIMGTTRDDWKLFVDYTDLKFTINASQESSPRVTDPIVHRNLVKASVSRSGGSTDYL